MHPPEGARGVSPARANDWGGYTNLAEDLKRANRKTYVIPMFETRSAADNLEEMLNQPGLRAAFVGLADLSANFGDLGGFGDDPQVGVVVQQILDLCRARGIAVGAMATSPDDAREKTAAGYRMIGIGSDMGMFAGRLGETVAAMSAAIEEGRSGGPATS